MESGRPVVVVGSGMAGVAVAVAGLAFGLRALIVEQGDRVGSAWTHRYDRLRLNSSRPFSHLPGRRYPRGTPMFPTRDEVIRHLETHAAEEGVDVVLGTSVQRIDRAAGVWVLRTSAGAIDADEVVVATGYENRPVIPSWPGREEFDGRLIHASQYTNAEPFRGLSVLVVGAGCSGLEIAYDLVEGGAASVRLAVRTPPNLMLRSSPGPVANDWIGVPLMHVPVRIADAISRFGQRSDTGDLTAYGLPLPEEGPFARMRRVGAVPTIVDPEVVDAIKDGRVHIVAGVEALDARGVSLADGTRTEPDAIVCATGYRRGLESLVGHLGVLDDRGVPRRRGADPAAPGLRFVGFVPRPGALGYMAKEGRRAAKAIARERVAASVVRQPATAAASSRPHSSALASSPSASGPE